MVLTLKFIYSFFLFFKNKSIASLFRQTVYCFNFYLSSRLVVLPVQNNPVVFFQLKNLIQDNRYFYYNSLLFLNQLKSLFSCFFSYNFICRHRVKKLIVLRSPFVFKNSRESFQFDQFSGYFVLGFKSALSLLEINFLVFFFERVLVSTNLNAIVLIKQLRFRR